MKNALRSLPEKLVLHRAEEPLRDTFWRPPSHVSLDGEALTTEELEDYLLSGSGLSTRPIYVEDPHKRGKFIRDRFVIDGLTMAIRAHSVEVAADTALRGGLGALCVLWEGVSIGHDTRIGNRSELRRNVKIGDRGYVGEGSVIGKRTAFGDDVHVLERGFVATDSLVWGGVTFGPNFTSMNHLRVESGVATGADVYSGEHVHIKDAAEIGNRVKLAHFVTIDSGEFIPDDMVVGDFTRRYPTAYWRHAPQLETLQTQRQHMLQEI